jgi:hypothetical protein
VLADGADGLGNLVSATAEETTRALDWFHISMRLRSIEQMSCGIATAFGNASSALNDLLGEKLHRVHQARQPFTLGKHRFFHSFLFCFVS